jgi:hypothetical protein
VKKKQIEKFQLKMNAGKKFNSAPYILAAKARIHIIYLQITVVNNEQINNKKQRKEQNIGEI